MISKRVSVIVAACLMVSGCAAPSAPSAPSAIPPMTATSVPTTTPTAAPSPTPTPKYPFGVGTALPPLTEKITAANADRLVEVARWGQTNGSAHKLLYSPSGNLIAISTSLGIYMFDAKTLKQAFFLASSAYPTDFVFSPDGQSLAVITSLGKKVEFWNAADGALIRSLDLATKPALNLAYSPDGLLVATCSEDAVDVWKAADGALSQSLPAAHITELAFSPDSAYLYVGSPIRKNIWSYRLSDQSIARSFVAEFDPAKFFMALSSDGRILAAVQKGPSGLSYGLITWTTKDGKVFRTKELKTWTNFLAFALSPDGTRVATYSAYQALAGKNDMQTWTALQVWQVDGNEPSVDSSGLPYSRLAQASLAFAPDSKTVGFVSEQSLVQWLPPYRLYLPHYLSAVDLGIGHLAGVDISPHGYTVASKDYSGPVNLWDLEDGTKARQDDLSDPGTYSVAYSVDGKTLVAARFAFEFGSHRSALESVNIAGGSPRVVYTQVFSPHQLAPAPNGKWLGVRGIDDGLFVLSLADGAILGTITHDKGDDHQTLVFSPDSQFLAAGNGTLKIVAAPGARLIKVLQGTGAAFSPDGRVLAYGIPAGAIQVMSVPDFKPQGTMEGGGSIVSSLRFSPDGTLLIGGTADGTIEFWRVSDGSLLAHTAAHTAAITHLFFTPDQTKLISASTGDFGDGTIRIWGVQP